MNLQNAQTFYSRVAIISNDNKLGENYVTVLSVAQGILPIEFIPASNYLRKFLKSIDNIDIAIVDLNSVSIETLVKIRKKSSTLKIVCSSNNSISFNEISSLNIHGFLTKPEKYVELLDCICEVVRDKKYLGEDTLCSFYKNNYREESDLTNREYEVLFELSKSLSYKQIAEKLKISKDTVKKHLEHIYSKLDVPSRYEAVDQARKAQII